MGEALDIVRTALGRDHQLVAIYALNKAAVHMAQGQLADALPLLQEGLRVRARAPDVVPMRRRTLHADDWSPAAAKHLLGTALQSLGLDSDAEASQPASS